MVFNKVISRREATSPPSLYTEASLLEDLQRVAKYVDDPGFASFWWIETKEKKAWVGTPATRSKILALLQQRGLMVLQNKSLFLQNLGFLLSMPCRLL